MIAVPQNKEVHMGYVFCLLGAIAFAVSRFYVPVEGKIDPQDFYKNAAHLFVGGLLAIGFYGHANAHTYYREGLWARCKLWFWTRNLNYLITGVVLTIIEVIAFKVRQVG